jgi:methionyl-tRNA formyltransferase
MADSKRLLLLANNRVGLEVTRFLKERGEEIAALVVHPDEKQKMGREIVAAAGLPPERVFDGARLQARGTADSIRRLEPEIGVSALFDYILAPELIALVPGGIINIHPAYLPYNRGQYPNVWSIIEGTPAGASLHFIDAGIDTGDLIAQEEVAVSPVDTGETLYRKLETACLDLFRKHWPAIAAGRCPRTGQPRDGGTYHRTRDVDRIDEIDLDREYPARRLIDVLRARTFPPYRGAFFRHQGKKVYLRLALLPEDEIAAAGEGGP